MSERLLLIFDNAIDANALKAYLPRGGQVKVLVTSNARAWRGVATPVEIPTWPNDIGADYLIARTGRTTERAAAEALSQALGGLPLAHEQAARERRLANAPHPVQYRDGDAGVVALERRLDSGERPVAAHEV